MWDNEEVLARLKAWRQHMLLLSLLLLQHILRQQFIFPERKILASMVFLISQVNCIYIWKWEKRQQQLSIRSGENPFKIVTRMNTMQHVCQEAVWIFSVCFPFKKEAFLKHYSHLYYHPSNGRIYPPVPKGLHDFNMKMLCQPWKCLSRNFGQKCYRIRLTIQIAMLGSAAASFNSWI